MFCLRPNRTTTATFVEQSLAMRTARAVEIGYDKAAAPGGTQRG
jgi:fumarate hydratase class II